MKVAAIVPAYNEEHRIWSVLSVVENCPQVNEIIVVDDCSTDGTRNCIPSDDGIRAVSLERNLGKGGALWAGVRQTAADVLLFLDADLVGLEEHHIGSLLRPVVEDEAEMCVGVFQGGRMWTDLWQKIVPYISGQRAMRREVFLSAPYLQGARFGVEVALTHHARQCGFRINWVPLVGVTHVMKEEKMGVVSGLGARARMYWDMGRALASCRWRPSERQDP